MITSIKSLATVSYLVIDFQTGVELNMLKSAPSRISFLVFLCLLKLNQGLRTNCKEVDNFKKRRECYEAGQTVTFLAGGYYFCCNLTHEQLVSIGASAFWTREVGFCGRGSCEICSKKQECVVFSDEDIFCCPRGYSKYQIKKVEQENKEVKKEKDRQLTQNDTDITLDEAKKTNEENDIRKKLGKNVEDDQEQNEGDLLEDT